MKQEVQLEGSANENKNTLNKFGDDYFNAFKGNR